GDRGEEERPIDRVVGVKSRNGPPALSLIDRPADDVRHIHVDEVHPRRDLVRPEEARDRRLRLEEVDVLDLFWKELDDADAVDAPVAEIDVRVDDWIQINRPLVRDSVLLDARIAEVRRLVVSDDLALLDPERPIGEIERADVALPHARSREH